MGRKGDPNTGLGGGGRVGSVKTCFFKKISAITILMQSNSAMQNKEIAMKAIIKK